MSKFWRHIHANTEPQAKKIYDKYYRKGKDVRKHESQRGGWTVMVRD